ncbi:MAG: toxin-antitoxin system YwqK family antitoxin [Bacteroidales bacterium]|nr:toxin-antitoxin system YwqK family antitoxin [Bacteroidales bacterium]
MKKFFKVLLIILLSLAVLITGYLCYHKFFMKTVEMNAFNAVPSDAVFVVETENLSKAWSNISGSALWQYLKSTEYFADLNSDIETVDYFLNNNSAVDRVLSDRKLLVVGCLPNPKNWDLVYLVDLQEFASYFSEVKSALKMYNGFKMSTSTVETEEAKFEIITLVSTTDPTLNIHLCLINNVLAVSLDKSLVERVIHHHNTNFWDNNLNFKVVSAGLSNRKMFKTYVNYKQIPGLYSIYSTEPSDIMDMFGSSLQYTAAEMNLDNDQIHFDGFTSLDSIYSYIRAFSSVTPGKSRCAEIMSEQTAAYLSMNFSNFDRFYSSLIAEYEKGNPEEMESMNSAIKVVETLLGFSVKDDFLGWIGNEITICKLRPLSEISRDIDGAAFIHASDIDVAKESLGKIITHLNRRTPVKIKVEPYRNFDIQYLGIKGFFKMFLGKLFENIEKPYFTYIEDYVVFANSQEVLHQIIDDYLQGRTLIKNAKFAEFKDQFENRTNISVFVQTPKMYETLYKYSPKEDQQSLEENKNLICSFARIGFQLVNDAGLFKTSFAIQYDSTALAQDSLQIFEAVAENGLVMKDMDSLDFKVVVPEDFDLSDGQKTILYDSSEVIHFEGNISNGEVSDIWRTYYPSGNLYATANYKNGKLNGIAYFYLDKPQQIKMAEAEYDNDELNGTYTEFYNTGVVKAKIMYEDGRKHGEAIYFYENGNPKMQCKFKKGERSGKSVVYDENGKKIGKLNMDAQLTID